MGKTMEEYEVEAERYEAWLSGLFKEAIYLIAEGIGVEVIDVEEDLKLVTADKDFEILQERFRKEQLLHKGVNGQEIALMIQLFKKQFIERAKTQHLNGMIL